VALRLVRRRGLTPDDLPDLEQDLWLDLCERLPDYRPERGHLRAFITTVVRHKAASILKARAAAKRGNGVPLRSLDEEFQDEEGYPDSLHETLSVDDYLRRTRGTVRSEEERRDLALDLRRFVGLLPPELRVVCLLLIDRNVCDLANVVGLPRSTLRDLVKQLRRLGERSELREYFE
jgi:RNA polymerase sigma factor (sigma-70 family)